MPDRFGGNSEEVTPVPIPNTEVKLLSADDTWRVTARESRSSPEHFKADILLGIRFLLSFFPFQSGFPSSLR